MKQQAALRIRSIALYLEIKSGDEFFVHNYFRMLLQGRSGRWAMKKMGRSSGSKP